MTLTNEDLLALSQMMDTKLDTKLQPIGKKLDAVEDRVANLEDCMTNLENCMTNLEDRMTNLEDRMTNLETRFADLEKRVASLEKDVNWMKLELKRMNSELMKLKICQETRIVPGLANIETCYLDTSFRYQMSADKVDLVCEDVEVLKKIVSEHDEKLKKCKSCC
ncbi:septation ring formation regulator EzrA [uncultured Eubacterium sp.]|nr:septation ring formation regulator EzrA [uncultured Eubacterium sp.]